MARFIQLISPILHYPASGRLNLGRSSGFILTSLAAWILVVFSLYCCLRSGSALLLGVATVQIAFSLLIMLEIFLKRINAGPLESRRREMTAYCIGGVILLLLCIYQFSEAYLSLRLLRNVHSSAVTLAVLSSISGNLLLVRLLWRSGLIRSRIRAFCQPLLGILLLNFFSLLTTFIIQLTHYVQLDAGLGMISSIVLFVIAAGMMIDAYWHLADIEMNGLKNNELEAG